MALSKDQLLGILREWNIDHETIGHSLSPTCEVHSENIRGTAFERFIGKGQAKNLFFKVPSGGGPLKNRLFLVCALVETVVDNKVLSSRLGIKPSAPLRFAADDVFTDVLQIPKGSVNPFVMAQSSCSEVILLLDRQFLQCERLLFHPMQSDFTTALSPDALTAFLECAAPSRFLYVDLTSSENISLSDLGAAPKGATKAAATPAAEPKAAAAALATHGFCDGKVADALASVGVTIVADPIGRTDAAGRLEGHSTHNFFVYDKKDKSRRFLVTVARLSTLDMKSLPALLNCKEVRLCDEGYALLGSSKGCVTPLSLIYDRSCQVQWCVDESILTSGQWRLGTSADGSEPGTVADVPLTRLQELLAPTGHWTSKRALDCSKWGAAAEPAVAADHTKRAGAGDSAAAAGARCGDAVNGASRLHVWLPSCSSEGWFQAPYETVSGRVL